MLEIKNLTKNYGDKKAVDKLSLEINGGEIYGFIGPNGAGKTTTIKSLVGILKFDEGEIVLGGTDIKKDPLAFKRKIAYIPDLSMASVFFSLHFQTFSGADGKFFRNIFQSLLVKNVKMYII